MLVVIKPGLSDKPIRAAALKLNQLRTYTRNVGHINDKQISLSRNLNTSSHARHSLNFGSLRTSLELVKLSGHSANLTHLPRLKKVGSYTSIFGFIQNQSWGIERLIH